MTETDIANLALALIGGKSLSDLDNDTTPQAVSCRKWFDTARDEALSAQNWNFAAKRDRLTTTYTSLSGSAVTSNSGTIRITSTSHGLLTGYRVYIADVEGVTAANGYWYVTKIDADTFDLDDSVFSGTYTSSTGKWVRVPAFAWERWFTLPTDCIKLRRLQDGYQSDGDIDEAEQRISDPYKIEDGKVLANVETAFINYTYRNSTTTDWTAEFITAFSTLLASYIAPDLMGQSGKSGEMRERYEKLMLPNARGRDAREGKGTSPSNFLTGSKFYNSRFSA